MRRCTEGGLQGKIRSWWLVAVGTLAFGASATAQSAKTVPVNTFVQELAAAQQLVMTCAGGNAAACDPNVLPDRELVRGGASGDFTISWQWLRDEISESKTASPADRTRKMTSAKAHLTELAVEAGSGQSLSMEEFGKARAAANAALARSEFRASAEGPTWTERQLAKIQDWLLRLFTGMDKVGRRAPWLAPLIEWACFAVAAAGLLWFVRQSLARQTLRIALSEGAALAGKGERDSADWARMAEEHAAERDWREAVHCLYWAAIALMESRRAWRANATRTPREYVRLLKPGTEAHRALRELTRSFERIWYGHIQADEVQYRTALESFRVLESSKPERLALEAVPGATVLTAGGA